MDNPIVETADGPMRVFDRIIVNDDCSTAALELLSIMRSRFSLLGAGTVGRRSAIVKKQIEF